MDQARLRWRTRRVNRRMGSTPSQDNASLMIVSKRIDGLNFEKIGPQGTDVFLRVKNITHANVALKIGKLKTFFQFGMVSFQPLVVGQRSKPWVKDRLFHCVPSRIVMDGDV